MCIDHQLRFYIRFHLLNKFKMEKLTIFYKKNTSTIYAFLFLIAAIFIVFQVILTALPFVGSVRNEVSTEQDKIAEYSRSIEILQGVNEIDLSAQADKAVKALPPSKDVQAIYLALTQAASNAHVVIKGFSVKVGDVFQNGSKGKDTITGVPFILANVTFSGISTASLNAFSEELSRQSPLSSIVRASITSGDADIDIAFYYKAFDLGAINRGVLSSLSISDKQIIDNLSNGASQ